MIDTSAANPAFLSTNHPFLLRQLATADNLLIIQDLDGVCMGLVRDPLQRQIEPRYIHAARRLQGEFFVLSNGEHIGRRGVNPIVDAALGRSIDAGEAGLYLPGLGAGGVQWQDSRGNLSHPGVSQAELDFLDTVPGLCRQFLRQQLRSDDFRVPEPDIDALLDSCVLDNLASPTVNINNFFWYFRDSPESYHRLQLRLQSLMQQLLDTASQHNLGDSFFIHYAPNLGRDSDGERIKPALGGDSGTTDFQFMISGAIKETGVLVILNRYYFQKTGQYPLGEDFNVRAAPRHQEKLLELIRRHFDPEYMPHLVGVGDTLTSEATAAGEIRRGGSDRGFLTLVQAIGGETGRDSSVLFVDSSGGQVQRPGLDRRALASATRAGDRTCGNGVRGISDAEDPLIINYVFPGGHIEYVDFFCRLADERKTAPSTASD